MWYNILYMARKKRADSYSKNYAKQFYELSCQGYFPSEIGPKLGVLTKYLQKWSSDPRKPEFIKAWENGREACRAFHSRKYQEMIGQDKTRAFDLEGQKYILKTRFADEWQEKKEHKIDINDTTQLTDEQLNKRLEAYLHRQTLQESLKSIVFKDIEQEDSQNKDDSLH